MIPEYFPKLMTNEEFLFGVLEKLSDDTDYMSYIENFSEYLKETKDIIIATEQK